MKWEVSLAINNGEHCEMVVNGSTSETEMYIICQILRLQQLMVVSHQCLIPILNPKLMCTSP